MRYHAKTVDKGAVAIVQAHLLDYPRRETLTAALGTIAHENDRNGIVAFTRWNERIDEVFLTVDEPLRDGLFQDIAKGRGYNKSPARMYLCATAYYRLKNTVLLLLVQVLVGG